ncbi:hypothetical protein U9M48_028724 [Paspalum notatum var. saurae]|uniref:Uncharacterized protein n=1 Tax=Paspalum notatum var. saurae TaxID=547442 RepID=A0AAQ3TXV0_PASNO
MVVADLGCSSGPNTLLVISEVMGTTLNLVQETDDHRGLELQFFLNALPGNDFNLIFRSLDQLQNRTPGRRKRRRLRLPTTSPGCLDLSTRGSSHARASNSSTRLTASCGAPRMRNGFIRTARTIPCSPHAPSPYPVTEFAPPPHPSLAPAPLAMETPAIRIVSTPPFQEWIIPPSLYPAPLASLILHMPMPPPCASPPAAGCGRGRRHQM